MSSQQHYRSQETVSSEDDYSSDEVTESEEEEEEEDEEEANQPSTPQRGRPTPDPAPSSSQQRQPATPDSASRLAPLSDSECLQLAADISERGGLESFSLHRLLTQKGDIYDVSIPGKKRQYQNKVNFWKTNGRADYNSLVLQQRPAVGATPPRPNRTSSRPPASSSNRSGNRSRRSRSRNLADNSSHSISGSDLEVRPRQDHIRPFNPVASVLTVTMNDRLRNHLNGAQLVNVDVDHPEQNNFLKIYSFINNEDGNKDLRSGVILEVQDADRCWMEMETEAFAAWLVAPNEVLVKAPTTSFSFLHEPREEQNGRDKVGFNGIPIQQAIVVPRNSILLDEGRHFKYFRYVFPKDLDNTAFSPGAEHGKIQPVVVPILQQCSFEDGGTTKTYELCVRVRAMFVIAHAEKGDKKTLVPKKKSNPLADQMSRMHLSLQVCPMLPLSSASVSATQSSVPALPQSSVPALSQSSVPALPQSSVPALPQSFGTTETIDPPPDQQPSSLQFAALGGASDMETSDHINAGTRKASEISRTTKRKKSNRRRQEQMQRRAEQQEQQEQQDGTEQIVFGSSSQDKKKIPQNYPLQGDPDLWNFDDNHLDNDNLDV